MKLKKALDIQPGEVISLVGGGGKTTIMFALARELASSGKTTITATTTKIFEPSPSETPYVLVEPDEEHLVEKLHHAMEKYRHITLASARLSSGKLNGISTELVTKLAQLNKVSYIIVEADGASHKSLKAPNANEPVIPDNTSLVLAVVGVDAVGCRLTQEHVFRPEIASRLLELPMDEAISAEAVARLITHPQGIAKGSPVLARIIPFINKVDLAEGLIKGRGLASNILAMTHPRIERVILGHAQLPEPVVEVIDS
ncbi:selenium cofactor biosynthesis protein YqeC [Chloroflexota bacterium]